MTQVDEFAASFREFMHQMNRQAPQQEPALQSRLREHFQCDTSALPIITETLESYDHPNLHLAVEAFVHSPGRSSEVIGVNTPNKMYQGVTLAQVVGGGAAPWAEHTRATEGPVEYVNIALQDEEVLACVKSGLYLVKSPDAPMILLIDHTREMGPYGKLRMEAMACERSVAESALREIRTLMRARNVYRGRVISLEAGDFSMNICFHPLPSIARDNLILPEGLLERVELQAVRFSRHAPALLAAGRHLKRGLLLHGPPGTGKTLTAMYLAGAMSDRTIILVTGRGQGLITQCCRMARFLQPSMVVIEDVDLIAEERTHDGCATVLLFELLNEMDGLAEDVDVLFVLTTNRPDLLEPALAARPGRIDQAIEIPLPDAECRRRLFELYARGLDLNLSRSQHFIERTEGASAAFIRELLRKSALFAADETDGRSFCVEDRHVDQALRELVYHGGDLTRNLLGFSGTAPS